MAGKLGEIGDDLEVSHEINVTPFIDVMLVLLIIFMVAAPLATVDINVDLPVSNAPAVERPDDPLYVTLGADLSVAVADDIVERDALSEVIDAITGGDRETRIFLRADSSVDYGDLMSLMNLLRGEGYVRLALVGLQNPVTTEAAP
jgi:biopolymer transport protein ExbD